MKNIISGVIALLLVILVGCSTKKDGFVNRNYHAVTSEYNILFNGYNAYNEGILGVKNNAPNNFWDILPTEQMLLKQVPKGQDPAPDPNFELAESKAAKAVQKHSMNIEGTERNPQMDEAYLLLGKARYMDQRYLPALESFNYILYKSPSSSRLVEARIWREKTNIQLENEVLAIRNLKEILTLPKIKDSLRSLAYATLGQAYINTQAKDSALTVLKQAKKLTKQKDTKARYTFIIAQLYDALQYKDSASVAYQEVIDMNRKAPRQLVMWAYGKQSEYFDPKTNDSILFIEKFDKLLANRENRPFLDVLSYHKALYYERKQNFGAAKKWYRTSLKYAKTDQYLMASNYRNLGDLFFEEPQYKMAAHYYDSVLTKLPAKSKEFRFIKKKRDNLDDVIKYEAIAQANDSILSLIAMNEAERTLYFENYIENLKKLDAEKLAKQKEQQIIQQNQKIFNSKQPPTDDDGVGIPSLSSSMLKQVSQATSASAKFEDGQIAPNNSSDFKSSWSKTPSNFYFYNTQTVANGKKEFKARYGNITLKDNWKFTAVASENFDSKTPTDEPTDKPKESTDSKKEYSVEYYLKQIPTDKKVLDSIHKDRNFAYFQLGAIYSEKFKRLDLATYKYENLLESQPEERLILPSLYNLYKIYEKTSPEKALVVKQKIIKLYPESRYAQLLSSPTGTLPLDKTPDALYKQVFSQYEVGQYVQALSNTESLIKNLNGEDIVPKLELLKSQLLARLYGLEPYKKNLQFLALTYPNSSESKEADRLLKEDLPKLEKLKFSDSPSKNWKLLYEVPVSEIQANILKEKLTKFVTDLKEKEVTLSTDVYNTEKQYFVIHGFNNKDRAEATQNVLKEAKDFKITQTPIIISSENYTVAQILKNLHTYNQP